VKPARVSVVVPSWNVRAHLAECLGAVSAARAEVALELVVVDDASSDGSAELVAREFPWARLEVHGQNQGFTAAVNRGLAAARGEYVLLLNADAALRPGALGRLVAFLDAHPDYAAAAPRLVGPDGGTLRACMGLPRLATALWHGTPLERWWPAARELSRYFARDLDPERDADVDQPPGACLLVRRALLEELGGLDRRLLLYFSDVDLSRRLGDRGWRTRYLAGAAARHQVGASTAQRPDRLLVWHRDRLAYYRIHHGALGAVWVKLCVLLAAADHLLRREARPAPILRQVASFLVS
jgi:GT2 family glycosyltransferase